MSDWGSSVGAPRRLGAGRRHPRHLRRRAGRAAGNRRPQTAMAWLLLIGHHPLARVPALLAARPHLGGAQSVAMSRRRSSRRDHGGRPARPHRRRHRRHQLPLLVRSFAHLNQSSAPSRCRSGNTRGAAARLRGCRSRRCGSRSRPPSTTCTCSSHLGLGTRDRPFFDELVRATERGVAAGSSSTTSALRGIRATRSSSS